jgi:hypothetical protein
VWSECLCASACPVCPVCVPASPVSFYRYRFPLLCVAGRCGHFVSPRITPRDVSNWAVRAVRYSLRKPSGPAPAERRSLRKCPVRSKRWRVNSPSIAAGTGYTHETHGTRGRTKAHRPHRRTSQPSKPTNNTHQLGACRARGDRGRARRARRARLRSRRARLRPRRAAAAEPAEPAVPAMLSAGSRAR